MESRNARLGLQLFCVYLLLYGGFVLINTFSAETMEMMPMEGVNLAIIYGFGLIIAALVLALIYGAMCSDEPEADSTGSEASPPGGESAAAAQSSDAAKESV